MLDGNGIKRFRKRRKMTQYDLADSLGITSSLLSNIENGKISCPREVADKFLLLYEKCFDKVDKENFKNVFPYNDIVLLDQKISSFIINNDIEIMMNQIIDMKLEKREVRMLFNNMLKHAKTLKKTRS